MRKPRGKERYLGDLSVKEFEQRLARAKKQSFALSPKKIDKLVRERYSKRLRAYDKSDWYLAVASAKELGVWKRAGHLPLAWTRGTLADTALYVKEALTQEKSITTRHYRAGRAIPSLLKNPILKKIQKEKYLFPIVFAPHTGTNGRRKLQRYKGDIDDGCMRSIALVASGQKKLKIYFGVPKSNQLNRK